MRSALRRFGLALGYEIGVTAIRVLNLTILPYGIPMETNAWRLTI
ncbi:hypothetical protein NST99_32295 [Paenibacillus sp. FSL L8-0470]